MKKEFLPYYTSRAAISVVFGILVMGLSWKAVLIAFVFFGLFLLYLHSGWFSIDLKNPFFPLRRDTHGQMVQRKALIIAIILGFVLFFVSLPLSIYFGAMSISGPVALSIGVITYFVAQFILFART